MSSVARLMFATGVLALSVLRPSLLVADDNGGCDDGRFAAYIGFTDAQFKPDRAAVRAFITTGSLSPIPPPAGFRPQILDVNR